MPGQADGLHVSLRSTTATLSTLWLWAFKAVSHCEFNMSKAIGLRVTPC